MWIFRVLAILAGGLILLSAAMPWWKCLVEHSQVGYIGTITIYQFGILDALPEAARDITPPIEVFFGLAFTAVSTTLVIWSTFIRGRKGQLVLGFTGIIYIGYALAAAFLVISPRIEEWGGSLQGYSEVMIKDYGELVQLTTSLEPGYYLACIAGVSCVSLAFFRSVITGKDLMPAVAAPVKI
jgi:hypothetical protein